MLKTAIVMTVALTASFAFAEGKEAKGPQAQAVDSACAGDAATAGCGNEKVGTGLMKCLHAYKKEHRKDFKISEGCKSAMHAMHDAHHEKQTK